MTIKIISRLIVVSICFLMLTGCETTNREYKKASNDIDTSAYEIEHAKAVQNSSNPVSVKSNFYADTNNPVNLEQPAWFKRKINFKGENLPFSFMLTRILRDTDAIISYQSDVQSEKPVSINYSGTIQGALDNLAMLTDYAYTINDNQINWSSFVTKNIDVSFMPGSSDYLVGRETSTAQSTRGDTTVVTNLDDSQHSSMRGTLSIWKDLETTLASLKSKDGTVNVSESTTSVMVHDHPANARAIEDYIKQLNRNMSRQVELKIKVLQINLDSNHQYGIDWNAVTAHALHNDFSLSGNVTQAIGVGDLSSASQQGGFTKLTIGSSANNNAVINSLGLQGKLSLVTEPTIMTLNNQVAEVRITTDTSYLEKSELSNNSDNSTSSSLTPGVVTDGFTLYVLPKIQQDNIYLDISSTLSTLKEIKTINNRGEVNQPVSGTGGNNGLDIMTIQVPTLAEKRFNVKSVVKNNETLIIAGLKQLQDQTEQSEFFGSKALGGRGVYNQSMETLVLITPIIIEN